MAVTDVRISADSNDLQQLADFIDHLKKKGVRSFKGVVPLGLDNDVEIDIVFDRDIKTKRDLE